MTEERRLVSVLFADVVGSTALGDENDPEVVRTVLSRYFERVQRIVESHGGRVEKFIGDAVMAVFGVPRLHDDDAERAVRAGLAIRDSMAALNADASLSLEARIGVNSGEAVAAVDERDQLMVTGDVINVAARLQQGAAPGEVVVGDLTQRLTRSAIDYRPRTPMDARGKSNPIVAFEAVAARSRMPEQARGLPEMRSRLVGRTTELHLLVDSFERVRRDSRAQLFTVVGTAGVGKSRLVGEFLAKVVSDPGVTVLRGRCLPYGAGITYWPLIEILQADLAVTAGHDRDEVFHRLTAGVQALIGTESERLAVRSRLEVLLGLADAGQSLPDVAPPRLAAELGWGVARYLEATAAARPLIAVVDDLQWAEPPAVSIVSNLLDQVADVPIFLVCIARPDLLEQHPDWGAGRPNSTLISLEPLSEDETRTLISRLLDIDDLPQALRSEIIGRAAGNPLFCEEFIRMLIEDGRLTRDGDRWRATRPDSLGIRVPESIHALLAARLDALSGSAKRVLQSASVIGEQFERSQVAMLVGDQETNGELGAELDRLVRAGHVVADRGAGPGAYRFRHILIRDVAYASLPKAERARIHAAFGRQLEERAGDRRDELTEILAHHAERAFTLGVELRASPEEITERGRRALELALDGGERAADLENRPALAAFLATAGAVSAALGTLPPADEARLLVLEARRDVVDANYPAARERLRDAATAALNAGRRDLAAQARLALLRVLVQAHEGSDADRELFERTLDQTVGAFAEQGDVGRRIAAQALGLEMLFSRGDLRRMLNDGMRLAEEAETAAPALAGWLLARMVNVVGWLGDFELAEQLAARAKTLIEQLGLSATGRWLRFYQCRIAFLLNRIEHAERELRALLVDIGDAADLNHQVAALRLLGEILFEAERVDEADEAWRSALELSLRTGERWSRSELWAFRADAAIRRGDLGEAERFLGEAKRMLREDDASALRVYNTSLGTLRAAQGSDDEAEAALRAAVEIDRSTEFWVAYIPVLDLAEFLTARGRIDESAPLLRDAAESIRDRDVLGRQRFERLRAALAGRMP